MVGGPCDGRLSHRYTVRPWIGFRQLCGTHDYEFGADGRFHDTGIVVAGTGAQPLSAIQVGAAWGRLMKALAIDGPDGIGRVIAARKRMRRVVR
jgi:hypothetical protein